MRADAQTRATNQGAAGRPARGARHALLGGLFALAGVVGAVPSASGQEASWPARPITIIVNVAAGSSIDVIARALSVPLREALGQPVVIDNRSGAAGNIGAEIAARAAPDGYTILASPASVMTINPFLYPAMKFEAFKDLVPVAVLATVTSLLVARPGLPVGSYPEFVAHARSRAGKLSYASPGVGSVPHLEAEIFNGAIGASAAHVPYRGGLLALQDVISGQVDYVFDSGTAVPHIRSGKVKLIAVATPKRSPLFPDTATLDELGVKGFDGSTTHGLYLPAGTPPAVMARLNTEINRAVVLPAIREQFAALGAEPTPISPAQFRTVLETEAARYGAVVKERKITVE